MIKYLVDSSETVFPGSLNFIFLIFTVPQSQTQNSLSGHQHIFSPKPVFMNDCCCHFHFRNTVNTYSNYIKLI